MSGAAGGGVVSFQKLARYQTHQPMVSELDPYAFCSSD